MRVSKPIILHLPKLFIVELDKYLKNNPPNFKIEKEYFFYVMHSLVLKQTKRKKDEFFLLDKKLLRSITASNIDRYIKILKNGEFIISDKTYTPNVKSLNYKINIKFFNGISKIEIQPESKLGKKIIKRTRQKKAHYNRLEPFLRLMKDELMKIELDYVKANKWIENNANDTQALSSLISINNIEDKRFIYFKRNRTNSRLDTNLTNLKSDLRQFIKGEYVSIDLKNSQPFLLSILIDNIINNKDTLCSFLQVIKTTKTFGVKRIREVLLIHQKSKKKSKNRDLKLFNESVLKGKLYDEFIDRYKGDIKRDQVKDIMFKVLFSRNKYYKNHNKIIPYKSDKKIFASVYPFVYDVVRILKENDNKKLPIYLQQLESYLFIDCIAKELVNNGIIPLTIHDSVIVKAAHKAKTIAIMKSVFEMELGVVPTFDIKSLKE